MGTVSSYLFGATAEPGAATPIIRVKTDQKWIEAILAGQKTISCHQKAGEFANVQVGQRVTFFSDAGSIPAEISTRVTAVTSHTTLETALKMYGTTIYPGLSTESECVAAFAATGILDASQTSAARTVEVVALSILVSAETTAATAAVETKAVEPKVIPAADATPAEKKA